MTSLLLCDMKNLLFLGFCEEYKLAEGEGFEPSEPVKAQHLSRVLLSATQPPFQVYKD